MGWYVHNCGAGPLRILATWLPHGRFRGEREDLAPPVEVRPDERIHFVFSVACGEPPGTVVENAFIILRVVWRDAPWLVFARLGISFDDAGEPHSTTGVITTQRIESA